MVHAIALFCSEKWKTNSQKGIYIKHINAFIDTWSCDTPLFNFNGILYMNVWGDGGDGGDGIFVIGLEGLTVCANNRFLQYQTIKLINI